MKNLLLIVQTALIVLFVSISHFRPDAFVGLLLPLGFFILVITIINAFIMTAREKHLNIKISKLSRELDVASGRVSSVSQEIGITVDENNIYSTELFEQTRVMSSLTSDVTENISQTITQMKDMISYVDEARRTTLSMSDTGKASSETIMNSISEIMHIVETMNDIKVSSSKVSYSIGNLKTASDAILTILKKINDISTQMHIIAINAGVEAARAGQYGSGFAVVAKEFHNLSSMTDHSITDIGMLIENIRHDINDVYTASNESASRVEDGVRYSGVVEVNLNNINTSFERVLKMVDSISCIAESESELAGAMGWQINQIEALIKRTNEQVSGVYQSALHQKKSVENITDMQVNLTAAAEELRAIATDSLEREALNEKTEKICRTFFPVINKELCANPALRATDHTHIMNLLRHFKNGHDIIEAVWTNELNGRFICSLPAAGIANAAARDWFQASHSGKNYISAIYISGITKNKCVTLSMPYLGDNEEIVGIIGVDLNLDRLQ